MVKEKTTYVKTCDFCGKKVDDFVKSSSESFSVAVKSVEYEIYYSGDFKSVDICKECNKMLGTFLYDNKMLNGEKK